MGDVMDQDRAYTTPIIHALLKMYQEEWEQLGWAMLMHSMGSVMFLLVASLGGMRGYEVIWTNLGALRYDLLYCEDLGDKSAVAWPIVGRFKARGGVADCYMIPIAGTTRSGIRFFEWTRRFVLRLSQDGFDRGWAFRKPDGTRALAKDYRNNISSKLVTVQKTMELIDPDCKV